MKINIFENFSYFRLINTNYIIYDFYYCFYNSNYLKQYGDRIVFTDFCFD